MKKFLLSLVFLLIFSLGSFASENIALKNDLRQELCTHSLIVVKDNRKTIYDGRGIRPLINLIEQEGFNGAFVADKVIGKASALLLVYGGAAEVYTPVISKPAVKIFKDNNIKYSADKTVDNVINREGTDLCPMEKKVKNIDNPEKAYLLFREIFKTVKTSQ